MGAPVALANRSAIAATDTSAGVTSASTTVSTVYGAVASLIVSTTGSPTGYAVNARIDGSLDGGTTWQQLLRFKDVTNTQTLNQYVRLSGVTAPASSDYALGAIDSAAASATVVDTPWPTLLRAVTELKTLTGGTAPTVNIAVYVQPA